MRKTFFILCFVVVLVAAVAKAEAPADPPASSLTLTDCYRLALKQSEKIAIQQELITEAEARFRRALGAVLPQATFSSSDKRQDGSGGSAFTLRKVPDRHFEFTQTLFGGFKEIAAMRAFRAEKRQRIYEKKRAEELLLSDVADAFYLLLEQRKDLEALEEIRTALHERIGELKEREGLGRSRPSEVVSAQAQLLRVEAEYERVQNQEVVVRQLLEFLTGMEPIGPLAEEPTDLAPLRPELEYVAQKGGRSDVQAAQQAVKVAEKQVTVAQAGFWPKVAVEGNYYVERSGASEGVDWDAALTVDVPLFEGGQNIAAVKEATARRRQAELRLSGTERMARLDIRDTYARTETAFVRTETLQKALKAAEDNYRLQSEDYRLNLVNNLDVLEALEQLQNARRDFIQAQYSAKRLYWQLKVAIGEVF